MESVVSTGSKTDSVQNTFPKQQQEIRMPVELNIAKGKVIAHIAVDKEYLQLSSHVWKIGDHRVHINGKSRPSVGDYSFNINQSVLENDFEVWVCGSADL